MVNMDYEEHELVVSVQRKDYEATWRSRDEIARREMGETEWERKQTDVKRNQKWIRKVTIDEKGEVEKIKIKETSGVIFLEEGGVELNVDIGDKWNGEN